MKVISLPTRAGFPGVITEPKRPSYPGFHQLPCTPRAVTAPRVPVPALSRLQGGTFLLEHAARPLTLVVASSDVLEELQHPFLRSLVEGLALHLHGGEPPAFALPLLVAELLLREGAGSGAGEEEKEGEGAGGGGQPPSALPPLPGDPRATQPGRPLPSPPSSARGGAMSPPCSAGSS